MATKVCIVGQRNEKYVFLNFNMKWDSNVHWFKNDLAGKNFLRSYQRSKKVEQNVEILGVFNKGQYNGKAYVVKQKKKTKQVKPSSPVVMKQSDIGIETSKDNMVEREADIACEPIEDPIEQETNPIESESEDETQLSPSSLIHAFGQNKNIEKLKMDVDETPLDVFKAQFETEELHSTIEEMQSLQEAIKVLAELCKIFSLVKYYTKKYEKIEKDCDLAIVDVEHYIEFNNFSPQEGFEYAKVIKKIRQDRRTAKDTLALLAALPKNVDDKQLQDTIQKFKNRTYTPRKVKDIKQDHN